MDKDFYEQQQEKNLASAQYNAQMAKLSSIEKTFVNSFSVLIKFLDGKTTKTEVVNQLKSVGTPDALKVVQAVRELDRTTKANKLDTSDLKAVLTEAVIELKKIPKDLPEAPEQRKSVSVDNISEVNSRLDKVADRIEKAISKIKLVAEAPKVDVKVPEQKTPIVNVDAPDLKPLQDSLNDILSGIREIKIPEVPVTDLSKLEKEAEKHTKQLQKLIEKPISAGGGGGGGATFQDQSGSLKYPTLNSDGSIPIGEKETTNRFDISSPIIYTASAPVGTLDASLGWSIKKFDLTDLTNIPAKVATNVSWNNRASGSYA